MAEGDTSQDTAFCIIPTFGSILMFYISEKNKLIGKVRVSVKLKVDGSKSIQLYVKRTS